MVIGSSGQVGYGLMQTLSLYKLISINRKECDIANIDQIKKVIDQHKPDLIINSAAFTEVDQSEEDPDTAFKANRDAPKVMAEKAHEHNIPFIHFSTDYVFDGYSSGDRGYLEDDKTNPLGLYGQSKLEGEEEIQIVGGQFYIFRTSWVYSNLRDNFYRTISRLSKVRDEIKVVADQKGVPTSNFFIAEQIKKIIPQLNKNNTGIYHLVPDGHSSWYDFAKIIIKQSNKLFDLNNCHPIQTYEYPTKAKRPQNSILNNAKVKKTFMLEFNDWKFELKKIIDET